MLNKHVELPKLTLNLIFFCYSRMYKFSYALENIYLPMDSVLKAEIRFINYSETFLKIHAERSFLWINSSVN